MFSHVCFTHGPRSSAYPYGIPHREAVSHTAHTEYWGSHPAPSISRTIHRTNRPVCHAAMVLGASDLFAACEGRSRPDSRYTGGKGPVPSRPGKLYSLLAEYTGNTPFNSYDGAEPPGWTNAQGTDHPGILENVFSDDAVSELFIKLVRIAGNTIEFPSRRKGVAHPHLGDLPFVFMS
jgi:hypothetical protein